MSRPDPVNLNSLSLDEILTKRRSLKRRLAARDHLHPVRIAVLGGSTTSELVDLLELHLLDSGFAPTFYQSEYGRFEVEALHDSANLVAFAPDIVYLHTSYQNLQSFPPLQATEPELTDCVSLELHRYQQIWSALTDKLQCQIIQNNSEFPPHQLLGNLDATQAGGRTRFVMQLNLEFARAAAAAPSLTIQDVCSLSARIGLDRWFDWQRYYSYKVLTTVEASMSLATSLAAMIRAVFGKIRKVLVLDLDNTLWGGVIGDDGIDGIVIGHETAVAEAYTAFQTYCLSMRDRGVLLAVCSKNDEAVAKSGFEHPDSILQLEHFASFQTNWHTKPENVARIAQELNLGTDSFVFVDDNPAERAIVTAQVEGIAVPDIGDDVAHYARIIEAGRYFEPITLSREDFTRGSLYEENVRRLAFEGKFADYGAYLNSLEMVAEIEPFSRLYLERITQLTNKTNQFNLTTRRYTLPEMEAVLADRNAIGLYGRLSDRFGDHGLISVVLGRGAGDALEIELWLMSCRVLKREMEMAMLDALVERAHEAGLKRLRGRYIPTKKNGMVADHYPRLGFQTMGDGEYALELKGYVTRTRHIHVPLAVRHL
jgi:FkbH-like protein